MVGMSNQGDQVHAAAGDPPATNPVFLRRVRGTSAYGFSRGVIHVIGILGMFVALATFLMALAAGPGAAALGFFPALLMLVGIGVLWQCALVIFDIADTLLYDAARRNKS